MAGPRGQGGTPRRSSAWVDWDDLALPLPRDTADRIASMSRRALDGDNVGLWLDKLVFRNQRRWSLDRQDRTFVLEQQFCREWDLPAGTQALARLRETVSALHPERTRVGLKAKIRGRLLVGYGRANSSETSVAFHSLWGVPKIPGSALKGVALAEMADAAQPLREDVFGTQEHSGRVVFYDALPVDGKFKLALDVLTPHHMDYYGGAAPPADWESPIPHTFLTVVETTFELWLGVQSDKARDLEALGWARDALKRALEERGVGAKTSAGYGRFEVEVTG